MSKAADALDLAADLITDYGWFQKQRSALDRDCLCANVALIKAGVMLTTESPDGARDSERILLTSEAQVMLAQRLGFSLGRSVEQMIITWNDTPGRTKTEVIAVLREVAEKVRAA